jgi:hypothetical protein
MVTRGHLLKKWEHKQKVASDNVNKISPKKLKVDLKAHKHHKENINTWPLANSKA